LVCSIVGLFVFAKKTEGIWDDVTRFDGLIDGGVPVDDPGADDIPVPVGEYVSVDDPGADDIPVPLPVGEDVPDESDPGPVPVPVGEDVPDESDPVVSPVPVPVGEYVPVCNDRRIVSGTTLR